MTAGVATEDGLDVATLATEIYNRDIKPFVELDKANFGNFVVVDVKSGAWEMAKDLIPAVEKPRGRVPEPRSFAMRVGYSTAARFGSSSLPKFNRQ